MVTAPVSSRDARGGEAAVDVNADCALGKREIDVRELLGMDVSAEARDLVGDGVAAGTDIRIVNGPGARVERLAVREVEDELRVFIGEDGLLVRGQMGSRRADEVVYHGLAATARGAVQLLELPAEGGDARRVLEARPRVDGGSHLVKLRAGVLGEHVDRRQDFGVLRHPGLVGLADLPVGGVRGHAKIREDDRHQVGAVELPGRLEGRHGVEVLHHARRHEQGVADFLPVREIPGVEGKLVKRIEHGIDQSPLLRRNLRKGVGKRCRIAAPHETHSRVLRHAEQVLGVCRVEGKLSVDGDLLEEKLRDGGGGLAGADGEVEVKLSRRVELLGSAVVMQVPEPRRELVHEGEPLLEVVSVEREASAVVEEAAGLRTGVERGGLGLRLAAVRRLLVEVRDARELGQLGGGVALRGGAADARRVLELASAEHVDRRGHELDAARGERLALAEVLELHVVAHDVRDELLAAEHAGDRLEEEVAHLVVRRLHLRRAQERREPAIVVAFRHSREAGDDIRALRAIRGVGAVREVDELLEVDDAVRVDLRRHYIAP